MARIRYGGNIKDKVTKAIVETLTTIGWEVALEAYRKRTYQNRTFNLHDSYGSAVFVDGVLVPDSIKYIERAMSKRPDTHGHAIHGAKTGRDALKRFFDQAWIVRKKDHITLLVAAAMWYGDILESKGYVVLDEQFVKNAVSQKLNAKLPQMLAKYPELKDFEPTIRQWVGIDEEYYIDLRV